MVHYVILSSASDNSLLTFLLATVYNPPEHHTEFADFLSELVLAADILNC